MTRPGVERLLQRTGLLLALLCPVAWLYTGWHLAVEAHHDHAIGAVEAHDEDRDHDGDHHHDDDAPAEGEGHHHDDHLIPDSLRPDHGPAFVIDLAPSDVVLELAATPAPVAAPCDDVPPATDPPIESRRPRAPPVG